MDQYLGFFSVDVWTVIFTWVNMFILFTIVKKLLFKPVMKVLDQRDAEIKKIYDEANQANEKAVNLEKEYSEKMAQARDEAGEIIKQATLSAQRREQEIISDAQEKVAIMTKRAESEIAQQEVSFMVNEAKLQFEADLLATKRALAAKKKDLEDAKMTYPLNTKTIIDLQIEVEGLEDGIKRMDKLRKEFGF